MPIHFFSAVGDLLEPRSFPPCSDSRYNITAYYLPPLTTLLDLLLPPESASCRGAHSLSTLCCPNPHPQFHSAVRFPNCCSATSQTCDSAHCSCVSSPTAIHHFPPSSTILPPLGPHIHALSPRLHCVTAGDNLEHTMVLRQWTHNAIVLPLLHRHSLLPPTS